MTYRIKPAVKSRLKAAKAKLRTVQTDKGMKVLKKYSVLLLRPAHVADGFGEDTYLAHVRAGTPTEAVAISRLGVAAIDEIDGVQAADYYPLLTTNGWQYDLTPGTLQVKT